MPSIGWTPRIVPYGADQTVYLFIDRFRGLGNDYRETEVERADLETIIADLMSGQFNDPIRVVAFNTLSIGGRTSQNISPSKFKTHCDIEGTTVPEHIRDFVTSYAGPDRQPTLRLV
jgi:hypothetical protein